eukprot:jgi/Mesvir1/24878/Mv22108-RA.2
MTPSSPSSCTTHLSAPSTSPQNRFTCPHGAYLDGSPTTLADKERMLRSHILWLLREGYEVMPGWETGVKLAGKRMWTYSDPMWPKPAHCKDVWGDATAAYNDCIMTNTGRLVFNHNYRFLIRLVTKAASTTILETSLKMLKGSQEVKYWVTPPGRAGAGASCTRTTNPSFKDGLMGPYSGDQRYVVMGSVREPIGRFISAFTYFAERTGHRSKARVTDFVDVLRRGFECADYTWGARAWTVKGFMHFLPAAGFFLLPHLLYAGDNDTVPYLDKVFRVEEMGELVPYLEKVKSGLITAAGPGRHGGVNQQLALARKKASVANAQAHEPVTARLRQVLSEQPEVMRLHCRAFIQDYVCFDYPLPEACADMILPVNDSSLLASLLPAMSMPSISMPSISMPSVNWSVVQLELGEIGNGAAVWAQLDMVRLNRLLLVIIGVLMVVVCWQQYKLSSTREESVPR